MKTNFLIKMWKLVFAEIICACFAVMYCSAQELTPDGDVFTSAITLYSPAGEAFTFSACGREIGYFDRSGYSGFKNLVLHPVVSIKALSRKAGSDNKFYVLNDLGEVVLQTINSFGPPIEFGTTEYVGYITQIGITGSSFTKIGGDKLYVLESINGMIESSDDGGANWMIDTSGLPINTTTKDFSLDTSQNIYAATSKGLYFQLSNSSTWNKITAFPITSAQYVFVDRKNKIWVVKDNKIYSSSDAGNSWSTTTLNYYLAKLCDDVYGNIYGIDNIGYKMIRSTDGGGTWTRVDKGITSLALDTGVDFGVSNPPIINDIVGDSVMSAATAFGTFFSSDQGNTWTIDNIGIPAQNIQGYQQLSTGRKVITTALGVFIKNSSDTALTQTYPVGKYFAVGKLWKDGADNLFIRGADKIGKINSVFKSVDGGMTWQEDTLGMHIMSGQEAAFHVDASGGQHLANDDYPRIFYNKPAGGSWALDTTNMHFANYVLVNAFTDGNGILYACGNTFGSKGVIMQRSLSSTSWSIDTMGLHNRSMSLLIHDANGNPIAAGYHPSPGTLPVVSYRYNNKWNDVNVPSSFLNEDIRGITYDDTQGLMIYLQTHNFTFTFDEGHGIYCTHDTGTTWNLVGLDSTVINQLESFGDTSFALSQVGLYKMTCDGAILISGIDNSVSKIADRSIFNYPNPFSESTSIVYSLSRESRVNVEVFDWSGRKISTLVNEKQPAGKHIVQFSSSNCPSGIYLCKVTTNQFCSGLKMTKVQ